MSKSGLAGVVGSKAQPTAGKDGVQRKGSVLGLFKGILNEKM
jgi:hypothetical protein